MRGHQAHELVARLRPDDLDRIDYVQLCSLANNSDALIHWAEGLPIELLLDNPDADFPTLYAHAKLMENHPVRVAMAVKPGFSKAVKLAAALGFGVRLEIGQEKPEQIDALARVLNAYLHQRIFTQPVDFFHSLLMAWVRDEPANLWDIQEENPALVRTIDDQGREHLPGRLSALSEPQPDGFVANWSAGLLADGADCADCEFFSVCHGYFKWPRRDYDCIGVKRLFASLRQAATEFRADLAAAAAASGGPAP